MFEILVDKLVVKILIFPDVRLWCLHHTNKNVHVPYLSKQHNMSWLKGYRVTIDDIDGQDRDA